MDRRIDLTEDRKFLDRDKYINEDDKIKRMLLFDYSRLGDGCHRCGDTITMPNATLCNSCNEWLENKYSDKSSIADLILKGD